MESNNLISEAKKEKNKIKSYAKYENIQADYFLIKIFNNLEKKKALNMIKYNKNIKNRINININDYKEYSEKYSSIEIEIKPVKKQYDKFINIKKEDEKYYHIYFNNNEEEIKRNYINKGEKIKIIKIIIDYQVESFEELFCNRRCIESIYFKNFFRNNINNMSYMFGNCSSLKELNLNNFNTINVTDMSFMFRYCSSLKELNLNNFNTNNVKNMSGMFYGCSSLKELNLNNFNTINVTEMYDMFSECSSLKELNLNNFNTINVTNMEDMFLGCSSLKELNLNNFNTDNVTDMSFMFSGCSIELIMKIRARYKNIKEEAFENKFIN